jgi:hypothetical protein
VEEGGAGGTLGTTHGGEDAVGESGRREDLVEQDAGWMERWTWRRTSDCGKDTDEDHPGR